MGHVIDEFHDFWLDYNYCTYVQRSIMLVGRARVDTTHLVNNAVPLIEHTRILPNNRPTPVIIIIIIIIIY
jgi:hypothetical protein